MKKYIKPKITTKDTRDLIEHISVQCNGYVTMNAGRTAMLNNDSRPQIVICKNEQETSELKIITRHIA